MKILQINSVYAEKSTGRTCLEVEQALVKAGHECRTAYGVGQHDSPNAYKIGTKAEYYVSNILGRITGYHGHCMYFATKRLLRYIRRFDPDIIHLRNLHAHYLHYPLLFRYLKKAGKPVVYNLHDCWILTGKCAHYTVRGCYKWKETCYRCPKEVVHQYPHSYFFDFTRKMHREKKAWLAGIPNLTVVGVSDWTADQARQSYLKDRRIERIYNWINLQVFYPREENVLARFGADPEKFTVICVSVSWAEGSVRYEYLKQLIQRVDENTQFIVVGQCDRPIKSEKVFHVAYVSDTGLLAKLYSSAHVYVHFSLEDTFGKVIAEAMACGTPAVVFRSTGCPELVAKGGGYAADPGDMDQVYKYVQEIFKNGKDYYRDACVKTTRESFSYETNVGQLMGLYEDILNKAQQESYP